jgi:hypothetical protein
MDLWFIVMAVRNGRAETLLVRPKEVLPWPMWQRDMVDGDRMMTGSILFARVYYNEPDRHVRMRFATPKEDAAMRPSLIALVDVLRAIPGFQIDALANGAT